MKAAFDRFTMRASAWLAKPFAFLLALALIIGWLACGPHYQFSDQWNLVINSATTVVTFLMAFVILSSGTRENAAIEAKLDEIIRALPGAHNDMVGVEDRTSEEIAHQAERIRRQARGS